MLYLKRKFDIRQWVLFNSSDGKVYLYEEPYVRTSSKECFRPRTLTSIASSVLERNSNSCF